MSYSQMREMVKVFFRADPSWTPAFNPHQFVKDHGWPSASFEEVVRILDDLAHEGWLVKSQNGINYTRFGASKADY